MLHISLICGGLRRSSTSTFEFGLTISACLTGIGVDSLMWLSACVRTFHIRSDTLEKFELAAKTNEVVPRIVTLCLFDVIYSYSDVGVLPTSGLDDVILR